MSFWSRSYSGWQPRKSAAERRAEAARQVEDAARRGHAMSPVVITGRKIAVTFWGKAWCDNLERYRDFAYRLERGRSYVRNGSVIDLEIDAGRIIARVSGSSLYDVEIEIDSVAHDAWRAIQQDCAGSIGSRVDLLSGRLSEPVMVRLCADRTGLFPAPAAIRFTCSCPDYAVMCKHVAAVMYGVGARFDAAPELLFKLRQVSLDELVAAALDVLPAAPRSGRVLASDGLAALFGIELADVPGPLAGKDVVRRTARAAAKPVRAAAKPVRAAASSGRSAARSKREAREAPSKKRSSSQSTTRARASTTRRRTK